MGCVGVANGVVAVEWQIHLLINLLVKIHFRNNNEYLF